MRSYKNSRPRCEPPTHPRCSAIPGSPVFEFKCIRKSSGLSLAVTLNVTARASAVRDDQPTLQGSRSLARAGVEVPLSDDRFVIFTYLPVRKLDVPDEAWAKVRPTKSAPAR